MTLTVQHAKLLSKEHFQRICLNDEYFMAFISNKVRLSKIDGYNFRHIPHWKIKNYNYGDSSSWLYQKDIKLHKLFIIEVFDMIDFLADNCRDFFYFDEDELEIYFQDKSDMDLFMLKFKILT